MLQVSVAWNSPELQRVTGLLADLVVAHLEICELAVRVLEMGPRSPQIEDTDQSVLVLVEGGADGQEVEIARRVQRRKLLAEHTADILQLCGFVVSECGLQAALDKVPICAGAIP